MTYRVLMVLTSHKLLADGETAAGSWLEELAGPYKVFTAAGCAVDFASIKGGQAPIDPASLEAPWLSDAGRSVLDNARVMAQLAQTPALPSFDAAAYDAVFLVGGAAVMWDFPTDPALGRLLQQMGRQGRVTAAVCHGVAGFLNPGAAGLVAGKHITCISDAEDRLAGYDALVPFMPEAPLRSAGARLSFAAEPFGGHAVSDGLVITGQNPASAARCAELVVERMKKTARA